MLTGIVPFCSSQTNKVPESLYTISLTSPSNSTELFPKSSYSCESFSRRKVSPAEQFKLNVVPSPFSVRLTQMTGCPRLLVPNISTTSPPNSIVLLPRSWYSDSFSVLSPLEQFPLVVLPDAMVGTGFATKIQTPCLSVNCAGHIVGRHSPEGGWNTSPSLQVTMMLVVIVSDLATTRPFPRMSSTRLKEIG